jgi:hypothetical protein
MLTKSAKLLKMFVFGIACFVLSFTVDLESSTPLHEPKRAGEAAVFYRSAEFLSVESVV